MGELVNVVVAFAVIVFLFRWVTSGSDTSEQATATRALGFRPKNVTPEMVTTVSNMFPDVPVDNIRFDLLRTGSVELTTNKILERGYLEPPPQAYYTLHPRQPNSGSTSTPSRTTSTSSQSKAPSLISRYSLQERINAGEEVPERELENVGGKAVWEDSAEKREESLKERKAKMVLAARQRFLAQQQAEKEKKAV